MKPPSTGDALDDRLDRLEQAVEDIRAERADLTSPLVEALLRDISARRLAEEELERAQAWIQLAQETGGVGAYHYDVRSDALTWSASTFSLYGFDPGVRPTLQLWLERVHPEDAARAAVVAEDAIRLGKPVVQEYRIRHADGSVRWIQDRGRVLVDVQGRPVEVVGLNIDITDLKRAEAARAASEDLYRFTFENAAVGVAHVGVDGTFQRVNTRLCAFFGYSEPELLAKTFQELTHPDDLQADLDLLTTLIEGRSETYSLEKRYLRSDGAVVWGELSVSVQRDAERRPLRFISAVSDITDRKVAEERLAFVMSEMDHRCRNLLTVVSAVAYQSARGSSTPAEMEQALQQRLQGLAASHDLLTNADLDGVSLTELVRRQTSSYVPADSDRVRIDGPDVQIRSGAVQTIGLALHELGTNASKYGA